MGVCKVLLHKLPSPNNIRDIQEVALHGIIALFHTQPILCVPEGLIFMQIPLYFRVVTKRSKMGVEALTDLRTSSIKLDERPHHYWLRPQQQKAH